MPWLHPRSVVRRRFPAIPRESVSLSEAPGLLPGRLASANHQQRCTQPSEAVKNFADCHPERSEGALQFPSSSHPYEPLPGCFAEFTRGEANRPSMTAHFFTASEGWSPASCALSNCRNEAGMSMKIKAVAFSRCFPAQWGLNCTPITTVVICDAPAWAKRGEGTT